MRHDFQITGGGFTCRHCQEFRNAGSYLDGNCSGPRSVGDLEVLSSLVLDCPLGDEPVTVTFGLCDPELDYDAILLAARKRREDQYRVEHEFAEHDVEAFGHKWSISGDFCKSCRITGQELREIVWRDGLEIPNCDGGASYRLKTAVDRALSLPTTFPIRLGLRG